ncbi:hypothetical protein ACFX2I_032531 [Malus domestica]
MVAIVTSSREARRCGGRWAERAEWSKVNTGLGSAICLAYLVLVHGSEKKHHSKGSVVIVTKHLNPKLIASHKSLMIMISTPMSRR